MSLDESKATALIRSVLTDAGGRVGIFVPLAQVLTRVGVGTNEVLQELTERRWIRVRDEKVAATKWAVEFGMDWRNVPVLLHAIVNSAGSVGKVAATAAVVATSGLDKREINKLMHELELLGLAAGAQIISEDGRRRDGVYITSTGWEYLTTSKFTPPSDEFAC